MDNFITYIFHYFIARSLFDLIMPHTPGGIFLMLIAIIGAFIFFYHRRKKKMA